MNHQFEEINREDFPKGTSRDFLEMTITEKEIWSADLRKN